MLFRAFYDQSRGCSSYMLGCVRTFEAIVVDPLECIGLETYMAEAADLGLRISQVIDTHVHADHVSLGPELAAALNVPYILHEAAEPLVKVSATFVSEGDELGVGGIRMRILHTPGHTPDSMTLVVSDTARGQEPWFLLTGDTLMVGDVGRPDLVIGDKQLDVWGVRERAKHLFHSLHEKLLTFPDHTEFFPGHFGGSTCGGVHMSGKASSTIGYERRYNLALQLTDEEAFTDFVVSGLKPQPPSFQSIKLTNLGRKGS